MSADANRRRSAAPLALVDEWPGTAELLGRTSGPPTHAVQFYEDEAFLAQAVARFVGAGLGAGEPAIVIATPSHWESYRRCLGSSAIDVEHALETGLLVSIDAREMLQKLMVDGLPDWQRFVTEVGGVVEHSARGGHGQVRAYGEMVDLLWREGNPRAAIHLEHMWNELQQTHSFSLLCAYVMGNFYKESDRALLEEVCNAHTHVVPADDYATLADADARRREVARLQQRARALENELEYRRELEGALREALAQQARAEEARRDSLARERRARAEAEAANRVKDEFLAMLGHELRNPLAPIFTSVQLSRMRGEQSRELDIIERQVTHMVRLVDDLLDVSRVARGKIELERERVELAEIVAQAIETASPLLEKRRQTLRVEVPARGCALYADRARLAQSVANLLTNAARYSEPGSEVIVLAEPVGARVRLRVRDHGIGIEPDLLATIFERFVQHPQSRDRARGGLGLGLAIARSLVELHGGTVVARSEGTDRGSEFEIDLPLAQAGDAGRAAAVIEPLDRPREVTPRPHCRLLVVDDNVDAAVTIGEGFTALGYAVAVAHDAASAVTRAASFAPHVALLDIGLPVIDGYELARMLRDGANGTPLRLIALTGYGQRADRARSREAGFTAHLLKPVDIEEVDRIITRLLAE